MNMQRYKNVFKIIGMIQKGWPEIIEIIYLGCKPTAVKTYDMPRKISN